MIVVDDEVLVIICLEDIRVSCLDIDLLEIIGMVLIVDNCDFNVRFFFEDVIIGGSCDLEC